MTRKLAAFERRDANNAQAIAWHLERMFDVGMRTCTVGIKGLHRDGSPVWSASWFPGYPPQMTPELIKQFDQGLANAKAGLLAELRARRSAARWK